MVGGIRVFKKFLKFSPPLFSQLELAFSGSLCLAYKMPETVLGTETHPAPTL